MSISSRLKFLGGAFFWTRSCKAKKKTFRLEAGKRNKKKKKLYMQNFVSQYFSLRSCFSFAQHFRPIAGSMYWKTWEREKSQYSSTYHGEWVGGWRLSLGISRTLRSILSVWNARGVFVVKLGMCPITAAGEVKVPFVMFKAVSSGTTG